MGMHSGILAATVDWPKLRSAFETAYGQLEDGVAVDAAAWFELPDGVDGFNVAAVDTTTYISDPRMVFTVWHDLVVHVSQSLSCLVAAGGAETVSGTFWFTAANRGDVRRMHWNVVVDLTKPFDIGDPLPSESGQPLEDPDGKGIFAALASLGFDARMLERPPSILRVVSKDFQVPASGELSRQINQHSNAHKRPDADSWMKNIQFVPREGEVTTCAHSLHLSHRRSGRCSDGCSGDARTARMAGLGSNELRGGPVAYCGLRSLIRVGAH